MATRAQPAAQQSQQAAPSTNHVPSLARRAAGPSLGSVPLQIRQGRGPWTWMVSPAKLGCRNGRIVPNAAMAWHEPGIAGNQRGSGGAEFAAHLRRLGYKEIPHSFAPEITAFGESRQYAPESVYLRKLVGMTAGGGAATRYVNAWVRPLQIGHLVDWEHDHEGRDAYLARAMVEIANGGQPLNAAQIRLATKPVIDQIAAHALLDTPRAHEHVRVLAKHLPVEHYTEQVLEILDRLSIEVPNTKQ